MTKKQKSKRKIAKTISRPTYKLDRINKLCSKNKLYEQQGRRCANPFCKKKVPLNEITIDHIKAKVRRGPDCEENYQLLCKECNLDKGKTKMGHWIGMQRMARKKMPKYIFCKIGLEHPIPIKIDNETAKIAHQRGFPVYIINFKKPDLKYNKESSK